MGSRLRVLLGVMLSLVLLGCPLARADAAYDWLQFDYVPQHSGNNTQESAITPNNVQTLQALFTITLPDTEDGAPAYLSGVATTDGVKDVLFVTTTDGHLIAYDAHSGAQIWSVQNGPGSCTINQNGSDACFTTSSPAVDPNRQYVYSYGLDGKVHKYGVADGTEITGGGWPEVVTVKPWVEKGSSALGVATARNGTSYLYMTTSGYYGDIGYYEGHVVTVNLSTGSQHVFNALCSNQVDVHFLEYPASPTCDGHQAGIWARPGVVYDPDTDRIYLSTGNGGFDPSGYAWGDSVLALNPDGMGANGNPVDSYTPINYDELQSSDKDLGSTAPAILPAPPNSIYQHLAVQSGKDAKLRLLNLDDLSGQGGPGHTGGELQLIDVPQGHEVLTQPAVWVNNGVTWVFVANNSGMSALQLQVDGSGNPSLASVWTIATGGTSPIVANGVLYVADYGVIQAFNPLDGSELWQDHSPGPIHWQSPIVANGALYVADNTGQLYAYALPPTTPTTVTIQAGAGWNLVGGNPVRLWADSLVNWAFNPATPAWYHPTGSEAAGTGVWEEVSSAGPRTVTVRVCTAPVTLTAVAHRWNLVGNPCNQPLSLPAGALAYWWNPTTKAYVRVSSIPAGAAAWVKPASSRLTLTPGTTMTNSRAARTGAISGRAGGHASPVGDLPPPPAMRQGAASAERQGRGARSSLSSTQSQ